MLKNKRNIYNALLVTIKILTAVITIKGILSYLRSYTRQVKENVCLEVLFTVL